MKKIIMVLAATLICGASLFTSCKKDEANTDNPTPGEVRLTQQYMVAVRTTGDTLMVTTEDFVWENGLLRNSHILMYFTGSTSEIVTNYIYDNEGNCIEEHETSPNLNHDRYYTYEGGRMIRAIEMTDSDTTVRVTITGHTADGHIQALTVEILTSGRVTDYQLTWQNGDMTGMPLAEAIFFPETIASKASVHNRYINNQEYTYGNGRLIRSTVFTDDVSSVTYYTYSDGTTGRK